MYLNTFLLIYLFSSFGLCFNKIIEKIGPNVNKTNIWIILPKIATDKDCAGVIPKIKAENIAIASAIPKFPGVIRNNIPMLAIQVKNNA